MTFDFILQKMLNRVPDDVDKLEGSIIYDALAPIAMELAETYSDLDLVLRLTFADSSDGEYLERRVAEHGVKKKYASKAIRKGIFVSSQSQPLEIPIGSRFQLNEIIYVAIDRMNEGEYRLEAETPGKVGNQEFGDLLPLEPIEGLGSATLSIVLIPGEDDETDEALYDRFIEYINEVAFGGNRADYKRKIKEIQGVGGVQLFRAPYGGGTVRAVIIDSEFNAPTTELVSFVQEKIDPIEFAGDGYGTAPIGHVVTIDAVEKVSVDFSSTLILEGVTIGQIQPLVDEIYEKYLLETRQEWAKGNSLVLRISHLESRILELEGVQDIMNTKFNDIAQNLILSHEIPVKGSVDLNE